MEAALIELISQQVLVTNAETKSQLNELKNDIKACRFMLNQILISVQNNPQSLVQTSVAAPSITYNDKCTYCFHVRNQSPTTIRSPKQ